MRKLLFILMTMQDISNAIKVVMGDAPEFTEFQNKVLVDVSDESGPMTPRRPWNC